MKPFAEASPERVGVAAVVEDVGRSRRLLRSGALRRSIRAAVEPTANVCAMSDRRGRQHRHPQLVEVTPKREQQ